LKGDEAVNCHLLLKYHVKCDKSLVQFGQKVSLYTAHVLK